jgi:hypothetical protein
MPVALLKLILLHAKAVARRSVRGMGTVRGAVFLTIGAIAFFLWLGSSFIGGTFRTQTDPAQVRTFFPLWLLAICALNLVTNAGERAIAFTPPEVDFLFPGPFTRRQLLGYKLLKSAAGAIVSAAIFSIVFRRYLLSWWAGWLGIFLSLLFLQLFSMSVVLIGETLGERAYTRGRRLIVAALVAVAALAVLPAVRAGRGHSPVELALTFRGTRTGQIVLAPFDVFGRVLTAPGLVAALGHAALAVVVLAMLLTILMWLDAQYLESAATAGQRVYDRIQRMRRGGAISMRTQGGPGKSRLRIPRPPRLGGAGPIAWRQLTSAVRQSRALLLLLVVMCAALAPVLYAAGVAQHGDATPAIIGIVLWMNFMFANALRFDFRGDLDQFDVLKSLPIAPAAVVAAELVAPTLVLTACQLLLFLGAAIFLHADRRMLLAAALVALPFNAMMFAIENLLFLVFPVRMWAVSPGDLQGIGRQMVIFGSKLVILLVVLSAAAGCGALAWYLTDRSATAFVIVTGLALTTEVIATIPLLSVAFRKFDPSLDTPP